ncbi:phosphatase PAP2 family protein [Pseudoxanthomonas sp. NC8]|nr:phosphatase PAP2 family protein [Pseudoxanthomonas sp. NC8]
MPGKPAEAFPRLSSLAGVLRGNLGYLTLLFAGVLLPLWLFAELADEVHEMEAMVFDDALLLRLHAWTSPAADRAFVWISLTGYRYGVVPVDILLSLALLAWRRWREAAFAIVAFTGSALLNLSTKALFQRQRPSLWESIAPETTFSFPSGHAMGSMTLTTVAVLLAWRTRWRWPVFALAAAFTTLVGLSRPYLGVHYPSDVLGGWAAGLAWAAGVYLVLFRRRRPWRDGSRWITTAR